MASSKVFHIAGFGSCHFFKKAVQVSSFLSKVQPPVGVKIIEYGTRDEYKASLSQLREPLSSPEADAHSTSPFVWASENNQNIFVGGCDDFMEEVDKLTNSAL